MNASRFKFIFFAALTVLVWFCSPELVQADEVVSWGAQRIINLYATWEKQLKLLLCQLGIKDIYQLRGQTDFLRYIDEK